MLLERAGQISNFQKEKYFNVELDCDGIPAVKSKIFDPDEAEQLRSRYGLLLSAVWSNRKALVLLLSFLFLLLH